MARESVEHAIENANVPLKTGSVTGLEKLMRAERWRIKTGPLSSDSPAGFNGAFLVPLEGEMWHVIISDGMGWRHLSATNAQKKQLPSWRVMCRLKDAFFGDDAWVAQFHPPKDQYVDDHPFCLHLWESIDAQMPTPQIVQV